MNNIYSKEGLLFLVQVDHLSGELLGSAIEYLYAAGARNVQILPSVTKKNRPGQSIIIDASDSRAMDIERIIVEELGSTGWHRFVTEHRHLPVERISRRIKVDTGHGLLDFEIFGKMIKNQLESVRPEHASCRSLQRMLKERAGLEASLSEIYLKTANAFRATSADEIRVYFDQTDGGRIKMYDETMKSAIISAAELATVSDVANLTADRVIALTGGHGMVTMGIFTAVNVITEEILGGGDIALKNTNVRNLPLEAIMGRTIEAAKLTGADGANAALIAAFCMYLAGSKAQVGIPAGNRKLGAMARMLAGVDRGGVAIIPTPKMNNKISGFAAVQAIYQAMLDKKLSPVDGYKVPPFVGGGPVYGHSALGEDIVWPAMAVNGAQIGTQAMLDSMAGASMPVHPFTAAVLGAAAILEVIHPDAEIAESEGEYGKVNSAYLVGKTAAETAGLPAELHLRITGEEFDTGRLIGDIGLILKDVGAPSVIGMMAFEEIFSIFEENIAGFSGTPLNSPLGHVAAYALIGMKALLANGGQIAETAKAIMADKANYSFDPETSFLAINIMAGKAHEIKSGQVTDALLAATEPAKAKAVHQKAVFAWEALRQGRSPADVVKQLDDERLRRVEANAQRLLTAMMGLPTSVKVLKLACGARRNSPVAKKYLSFDPLVDLRITVGDKTADFPGFVHDIVPKYCLGQCDDIAWAIAPGAAIVCELVLGGSNILNVVVPVAVAAAMGAPVSETADSAVKAAFLSAAIPGLLGPAVKVGNLAKAIMDYSTED